jgi:hypothetical protein
MQEFLNKLIAAATVLFAITGLTVIWMAVETLVQPPDVTVLLSVVCVNVPGI